MIQRFSGGKSQNDKQNENHPAVASAAEWLESKMRRSHHLVPFALQDSRNRREMRCCLNV